MRGNLLTLMHGWLNNTRPTGDKLKGEEFKRVRSVLMGQSPSPQGAAATCGTETPMTPAVAAAPARNIPLAQSENEKAHELVTLDEKFWRDVAHMPPSAASYVRHHPCLSIATMEKWRVGVLPQDGGSDKRGWSLRGQVLYPILSEDGKLLAWAARDPQFEMKEQTFNALAPDERAKRKNRRSTVSQSISTVVELFGQHAKKIRKNRRIGVSFSAQIAITGGGCVE